MKSKQRGTSTSAASGIDPSPEPLGKNIQITDDYLAVTLKDGRIISTPLEWYPRLHRAKPADRGVWEWDGDGIGIHWPLLDEDLSIAGMLRGVPSMEYKRQQRRLAESAV